METQPEGGWGVTILSVLIFAGFISSLVLGMPWWVAMLLLVIFFGSIFFAVLEEWAPKDFIFTMVPEGTFKIVTEGGEVVKILLRWKNHHLATDDDIAEAKKRKAEAIKKREKGAQEMYIPRKWDILEGSPREPHRFGGFEFVGFPPFRKVWWYEFEWASLRSGEGEKEQQPRSHKKMLDYALVKWDTYVINVPLEEEEGKEGKIAKKGIEDANQVPMGVVGLFPMRIVNPYEAFFEVERWLPAVTGVLQPPLKRFLGRHPYEDLVPMARKGEKTNLFAEFWQEVIVSLKEQESVTEDNLLTTFRSTNDRLRIYGIEIDKKRSGILDLDPASSYRRLSTKRYEAAQEGEAERIRRAAKGRGVSEELTAAVWGIAAQLAGVDPSTESVEDKQRVQEFIPVAWNNFLTQQGIEAISPTDKVIITSGGKEIGGDLAGLSLKEVVRKTMDVDKETKKEE